MMGRIGRWWEGQGGGGEDRGAKESCCSDPASDAAKR